jgi:hypothetical protein
MDQPYTKTTGENWGDRGAGMVLVATFMDASIFEIPVGIRKFQGPDL